MVIDSMFSSDLHALIVFYKGDLEVSTGLSVIHKKPLFIASEYHGTRQLFFFTAAGFGFVSDKLGVFSHFLAVT